MTDVLTVPQGDLQLVRYPTSVDASLRAWDAADALVLEHLAETATPDGTTLIVNDAFGALAVGLSDRAPRSWSDSSLAHEATRRNLAANDRPEATVTFVPGTEDPTGPIAVAVIKIPRSLALLEEQLRRLRPHLAPGALVVAGGMVKHVHTSTLELFDTILGPTTTSRATRKARLIFTEIDPDLAPAPSPFPTVFTHDGPAGALEIVNHAGVFSASGLDQGTRVLLANLPTVAAEAEVIDLGCGNGIVGTVIAQTAPQANVTFVDESHGALASARATFSRAFPEREAIYLANDALDGYPGGSVDLIVCNPPFHAQAARGDDTAWSMFTGAHRVLRHGGTLVIVGNRHLGYDGKLTRIFGGYRTVSSTPKFVVLAATKDGSPRVGV